MKRIYIYFLILSLSLSSPIVFGQNERDDESKVNRAMCVINQFKKVVNASQAEFSKNKNANIYIEIDDQIKKYKVNPTPAHLVLGTGLTVTAGAIFSYLKSRSLRDKIFFDNEISFPAGKHWLQKFLMDDQLGIQDHYLFNRRGQAFGFVDWHNNRYLLEETEIMGIMREVPELKNMIDDVYPQLKADADRLLNGTWEHPTELSSTKIIHVSDIYSLDMKHIEYSKSFITRVDQVQSSLNDWISKTKNVSKFYKALNKMLGTEVTKLQSEMKTILAKPANAEIAKMSSNLHEFRAATKIGSVAGIVLTIAGVVYEVYSHQRPVYDLVQENWKIMDDPELRAHFERHIDDAEMLEQYVQPLGCDKY